MYCSELLSSWFKEAKEKLSASEPFWGRSSPFRILRESSASPFKSLQCLKVKLANLTSLQKSGPAHIASINVQYIISKWRLVTTSNLYFPFYLSRGSVGGARSIHGILPRPQDSYGSVPGPGLWHREPEFSSPPTRSWLSAWPSGSRLSWHCEQKTFILLPCSPAWQTQCNRRSDLWLRVNPSWTLSRMKNIHFSPLLSIALSVLYHNMTVIVEKSC